ncbi:MAG: tRNA threonylcarbamoyladenosine dehydratase [Clostridiaceae bacterium]|nr:tRNA threonylcarbamoyladenosine dehydratase [Clostridiaceae bacterium]
MDEHMHARTALLLGEEAIRRLDAAKVAVVGLGGVGGIAAEALVRAGVGKMVLVDSDRVAPSNLNRQIVALHSTIGHLKVDVMRDRLLDINPDLAVKTHPVFVPPEGTGGLLRGCDYVVDAIDTVPSKVGLILECRREGIPVLSCMGAGNRLDPTRFEVADLFDTSVCPLCRVMRRQLRQAGLDSLPVVYSKETPVRPQYPEVGENGETDLQGESLLGENLLGESLPMTGKRRPPGSISFGPPAAGLVAAGEVIRALLASSR